MNNDFENNGQDLIDAYSFVSGRVYDSFSGFKLYSPSIDEMKYLRRCHHRHEWLQMFTIYVARLGISKRCLIIRAFDKSKHYERKITWGAIAQRGCKIAHGRCTDGTCNYPHKLFAPKQNARWLTVENTDQWREVAKTHFRRSVYFSVGVAYPRYSYNSNSLYYARMYKPHRHLASCVEQRRRSLMKYSPKFLKKYLGDRHSCLRIVFDYLDIPELVEILDFRNWVTGKGLSKRKLEQVTISGGPVNFIDQWKREIAKSTNKRIRREIARKQLKKMKQTKIGFLTIKADDT